MQHVLLTNPEALMTVGRAAELCQVYRGTVQRWISSGKLKAHKLPSGHYRVRSGDLNHFLTINQLPLPMEMRLTARNRTKILIVDPSANDRNTVKTALNGLNGDIEEVSSGVAALLKIGEWRPSLVIMNVRLGDVDGVAAIKGISANPVTCNTRILVSSDDANETVKKKLNRNPCVVGYMNKSIPGARLRKKVEKTIGGLPKS